jgi:preprotein translocase subunit SecY
MAEVAILNKLANIFRVPDLRKRVLFTLGLLAVYRIGGHIPTPGINGDRLAAFFEQNRGSVLGFVDLFSGGNLRRLTIFALGIMPYITASIILQLLTVVYEPLAKLQEENYAVDALSHRCFERGAVVRYCHQPAESWRFRQHARARLHPYDHADADDRQRLHHVAG